MAAKRGGSLVNPIKRIYDPALYQGRRRASTYFEGWYFKLDTADGLHPIAVIPGVSHARHGVSHAFVQLIRGDGATAYYDYPASDFRHSDAHFQIEVGPNCFSRTGMSLDLKGDGPSVQGDVAFSPWSEWPVTLLSPGIMGPYRFVPFMECYHGVLSMDHSLSGILRIDGNETDFDGGRGYAEKDWGRSFPEAWVWAQCNGFEAPGTSVTLSVARIPWLGSAFTGIIAGVLLGGRLYRFATYTGARLEHMRSAGGNADIVIADRTHRLHVRLSGAHPGLLRSPVLGGMDGTVLETLSGTMHVVLEAHAGGSSEVLLDATSTRAAIEMMDDKRMLET